MVSKPSNALMSLRAMYQGVTTAAKAAFGSKQPFTGNYDDPKNLTVVHVVASWKILASAAVGTFWLAVSYPLAHWQIVWVLLPFSLFWFGLAAWLLHGKRFWMVYTERHQRWALVYDGLTLAEANDMADSIRNATGLRLRSRQWKLPPGGRKGFWGGGEA
jgi:hypothetical protein